MLFADSMECPLSKEELLELVEEEARLRVSADFLEEVATCIFQMYFNADSSRRWSPVFFQMYFHVDSFEEVATCISQMYFHADSLRGDDTTSACVSLSGGSRGERGQNGWNRCYRENARGVGEKARPSSGDGGGAQDCTDVVPRAATVLGPSYTSEH